MNENSRGQLVHPIIDSTDTGSMTFERSVHNRCLEFLTGSWSYSSEDDVGIEYIEGGLTNYLYKVYLKDHVPLEDVEPRCVILRRYGEIHSDEEKHKEAIIFAILSERKIGPRLIASFPEGRIEEYIPTRSLVVEDIRQPYVSWQIAEMFAEYHLLDMPSSRTELFVKSSMESWFLQMKSNPQLNSILVEMNIAQEYAGLRRILQTVNSPIVFCHNDLQEGNIMFESSHSPENPSIRFIDFEYSCYNHRGFDLGNHFCEWSYNNHAKNALGFSCDLEKYPSGDHLVEFCKRYMEAIRNKSSHLSKKKLECLLKDPNQLAKEINLYSLESHIFWGVWGLVQHSVSKISYSYKEYAISRFESYFYFKKIFMQKYGISIENC